MPVWGLVFQMNSTGPAGTKAAAESSIARLVDYLRTIQKK
jgi:hypothetical protein